MSYLQLFSGSLRVARWGLCASGVLAALLAAAPAAAAVPCQGGGVAGLISMSNARGQTLSAWQDYCSEEEGLTGYEDTQAALGSIGEGFTDLGTINASGTLSEPSSVALDDAGGGWVGGTYQRFAGYGPDQFGPQYESAGGWLAARPPGGAFGALLALPGGARVEGVRIAGNASGEVIVAWNTPSALYAAWTSPAGGLEQTRRFASRGSILSGVSIDAHGRALVIAIEGHSASEGPATIDGRGRKIVTVHGSFGAPFARPQVVLQGHNAASRHQTQYLTEPLVAANPRGGAVIATNVVWREDRGEHNEHGEKTLLLALSAQGRVRPRLTINAPLALPEFAALAVDGRGRILLKEDDGPFLLLAPDGRRLTRWPGETWETCMASNAVGQIAVSWIVIEAAPHAAIGAEMVDPDGHHDTPVRFPLVAFGGGPSVSCSIDATGLGMVFWSDQPTQAQVSTIFARTIGGPAPTVEVAHDDAFALKPLATP